jgi:hypothetical protein
MKTAAIAYIRVSTARQGRSGLGLEAQLAALERFALAEGYNFVQTFEEVETGKGSDALASSGRICRGLETRLASDIGVEIIETAREAQDSPALRSCDTDYFD